jgi:cell division protein FtsX
MTLLSLLIVLIVLGLVWWLVWNYLLPRIGEPFRTIVIVLMVLLVVVWLLSLIGIVPPVRLTGADHLIR